MSIKCVVLVVALSSLTICCFSFQVSSSALARLFGTTTISRSRRILIITVLIVTKWVKIKLINTYTAGGVAAPGALLVLFLG